MAEEEILLQKAHNFDLESLEVIYDTFSPGVYRYAMRLLGNPDLAEECVSETFQRFLVALKNNGGPSDHLQAYLYRIAHNWITDQYRRQPLTLELSENLSDEKDNPAKNALERIEQQGTGLGDAATDHEGIRIEEPSDAAEGRAQPVRNLAPDLARHVIA